MTKTNTMTDDEMLQRGLRFYRRKRGPYWRADQPSTHRSTITETSDEVLIDLRNVNGSMMTIRYDRATNRMHEITSDLGVAQ